MTSFKAAYKLELRSPGRHHRPRGFQPSHSFVKQFMQILRSQFDRADEADVRDIYNNLRLLDWDYASNRIAFDGAASQYTWGPCIGTDDTAESVNDYHLGALIVHGTDPGEMEVGDTTIVPLDVFGDDVRVDIQRTFSNNSGNTITVKEVGLQAWAMEYNYLCIRDLPSPDYEVPNGGVLTLTYRLYTTN